MRKTKIVATLGPATSEPESLRAVLAAGVDVVRLNFSHGDHATHRETVARVREAAAELDRPVAILQDLQGPKIRTGKLAGGGPVELVDGCPLTLTTEPLEGTAELVSTTYTPLPDDVQPGDRILLSDGALELRVESVAAPRVHCTVVHGGKLKERQGMNLPGVKLSTAALTEKDRVDLALGLELGVDFVALSFVRRPEDIAEIHQAMDQLGHRVPVIAKIEKPEAVDCLEAIVKVVDGLMVARGDLGVEMRPEKVPMIQKRAIRLANQYGKPVITATQMLESMIQAAVPTRAEASDVANAILDGTDAVMLSGETSIGRFPAEAVRVMDRIARETEPNLRSVRYHGQEAPGDSHEATIAALADAACHLAERIGAAAIVPFTLSGRTALAISNRRPDVPVYALTPVESTWRRTALWWGVHAYRFPTFEATDEMIERGEEALFKAGLASIGDVMVCIAGVSTNTPGGTNLLKIHAFDGVNPYARET